MMIQLNLGLYKFAEYKICVSIICNLWPYPAIVQQNFDLLQFIKIKCSKKCIDTMQYVTDACLSDFCSLQDHVAVS